MPIKKSEGVTPSERLLADLCDGTFLRLWSYPNPYKDDAKELCDLIVFFEETAFVFFDREKALDAAASANGNVSWERWKRRVIDRQIKTADGAERYLRSGRKIFLDSTLSQEVPFSSDTILRDVYKIIVAHGAAEACMSASQDNVYGSLAILYGNQAHREHSFPFLLHMEKDKPVHVLDTHNLPIVLKELDTVWDFTDYLKAKEKAIEKLDTLLYCGEEDLLAHYFLNYNEDENCHFIGVVDPTINSVMIGEGEWKDFIESGTYTRTNAANEVSYFWDELLQRTANYALEGRTLGHSPIASRRSAIHEMAKEPRFSRRTISDAMIQAIQAFPEKAGPSARNISLIPSFYPEKRYVFLQLRVPNHVRERDSFRELRQFMLEVACGAAKNAFPEIGLIVGIAIDAPKFYQENSEDFILMECTDWTEEQRNHYQTANVNFGFFQGDVRRTERKATRFVPEGEK